MGDPLTCWRSATRGQRRARPGQPERLRPTRSPGSAPLLKPLEFGRARGHHCCHAHTQRGCDEFLVATKKAHYILIVKKNRPDLYAQVKNLPWLNIPAGDRQHHRGHGRDRHRTLKTATAAGLTFPHARRPACSPRSARRPTRRSPVTCPAWAWRRAPSRRRAPRGSGRPAVAAGAARPPGPAAPGTADLRRDSRSTSRHTPENLPHATRS